MSSSGARKAPELFLFKDTNWGQMPSGTAQASPMRGNVCTTATRNSADARSKSEGDTFWSKAAWIFLLALAYSRAHFL